MMKCSCRKYGGVGGWPRVCKFDVVATHGAVSDQNASIKRLYR
ncbi:predicted protein [Sclerotinia sclerotiorum 1980 UF-70]|uniref:Uncharacterized protein n=1 Tax=Sclerotinia sclerotiorum (strain ATCC 18683 / 1980 / Ss-1) TaxID=665079 RepID=A7EMJ6_SCLS1|nr:predicted protein [Sclerotinia sclerotiorum 1980 UF-70]EDO04062.1 predicted protein [Sclerotinia sclerotiorum 1980 UF-70]